MKREGHTAELLDKRFGKSDLDRIGRAWYFVNGMVRSFFTLLYSLVFYVSEGYFHDPSPAPFDKYRETPVKSRDAVGRERQMLAGPSSDLFEEKFARIFYGEALHEPWRFEAKERLEREKAKIGGVLLPPSPAKKHSTPGDYYGCFEKVTHFKPAASEGRRKGKQTPELPNVKIKPNPLGGPGYADICLSRFPSYSHDPYDPPKKKLAAAAGRFLNASAPLDYFPPNPYEDKDLAPTYKRPIDRVPRMIGPAAFYVPFPKKPGGNHSGCFDKFPLYSGEPYDEQARREMEKKPIGVFVSGGPSRRTKYTTSVIDQVTKVSCNATNYADYKPQVYPLNEQRI